MSGNGDSGKIYYVCCATGQMQTNWQALRVYEPRKVERILVLVGMSDPKNPSDSDRMQAVEPAESFKRAAVSLAYPTPDVLRGKAASFDCWRQCLAEWAAALPDKNLPIVFNVTGGTKPMNFGGAEGLRNGLAPGSNLQPRIVYADRGHALYEQGASPESKPLPELDLAVFLAMHGYVEPEKSRERRLANQKAAPHRQSIAIGLWDLLGRNEKFCNAFPLLAHAIKHSRKSCPSGGQAISIERDDLNAALPTKVRNFKATKFDGHIRTLCVLSNGHKNPSLWIRPSRRGNLECSPDFGQWIGGQWLEELVFNNVVQMLQDRGLDTGTVHLGVKLYRVDADGKAMGETARDLDVAFVAKGQLHVVECKTEALNSNDARQAQMKYLMTIRQEISGLHGLIGFLHPREVMKLGGANGRAARDHGLSFWQGGDALEKFEEEVEKRLLS